MTSVAVAVHGGSGSSGGKGSLRAVKWAVENLMPKSDRFILVNVIPKITSIPTPRGDLIPISELDPNVVAMYVQDMKEVLKEVFIPFKKLCKTRQVETLILEDDNPAAALLRYISENGISYLVLGSCSSNFLTRKLKGPGLPTNVLLQAAKTCDIYVVYKDRVTIKAGSCSFDEEASYAHRNSAQTNKGEGSSVSNEEISWFCSSVESEICKTFEASTVSDHRYRNSEPFTEMHSLSRANGDRVRNFLLEGDLEAHDSRLFDSISMSSLDTDQSDVNTEAEQLRRELHSTLAMYQRACEGLVHAQQKVQLLSSECLEDTRKINAAFEREENLRKIAAEEKAKHLEAMKEIEKAKALLAKEAYERQIAELNATKESSEKKRFIDALFSGDRRYRKYNRNEIEVATDFFSEINLIGEGGYGKVYKCSLDHTPAAVKLLQSDAANKKEEFLKEVEVLSQLHHPNIVLLLGACPESGCLVYEYLENGSLEDYISPRNRKSPLPWFIRFRIVFEIACGLAFLHNSKPEPIVHRDLKPGNILLDKNYVSKIGDVGLAKLISDVVPDNVTEYRDSILAGTLFYMDPEYQKTGTLRPKSDLYAFGVIVLQLLTGRHPNGLLLTVENAISNNSFSDILDKSVSDWPVIEAEQLARLALSCSNLRCRDRPELGAEVLPALKKIVDAANAGVQAEKNKMLAPIQYYCPIIQEIMDDPHIAADGFTYEYIAIKTWLEKHNVSPVTKLRLHHSMLTPDHTLRSAIHDWRSQ